MKHVRAILLLLCLGFVLHSRPEPTLTVVGELGTVTRSSLAAERIAVSDSGGLIQLGVSDRLAVLRAFARVDRSLCSAAQVHRHNLANRLTTKTPEGLPYARQSPIFAADGSFEGTSVQKDSMVWVYDPAHVDAMKDGPKLGYVALPDVKEETERFHLAVIAEERRVAQEIMSKRDPSIVFANSVHAEGGPDEPLPIGKAPSDLASLLPSRSLPEFRSATFERAWSVAQARPASTGHAAAATALNWLHQAPAYSPEKLRDKYGDSLLEALKTESARVHIDWYDAGDLSREKWPEISATLQRNSPVLLGVSGGLTSRADVGPAVVMLVGSEGEQVRYIDPVDSAERVTTLNQLLAAPPHPDGKFVFLPCALEL